MTAESQVRSGSSPVARLIEGLALLLVCATGLLAILEPLAGAPAAHPRAIPGSGCQMEPDGYLRGTMYGARTLEFNWSGRNLSCDGMLRPQAGGIRLFFARSIDGAGHRIVVVLGIDATPDTLVGEERPANVTVIDEQSGRFFSSGGAGRCWTAVDSLRPMPGPGQRSLRVEGHLYCAGALPSVGDLSSLTLGDISFAGRLSTDGP